MCDHCGCDALAGPKKEAALPRGTHQHWHVHADGTAHSHPHGHEHGREHAHAHRPGSPDAGQDPPLPRKGRGPG